MARCSVVVPTFNTAALLEQCLQALSKSITDCADVEIVVSDDGSTDATPAVVAAWEGRIRSVRSTVNRGFAAACNAGAAVASGRQLVFYNTDLVPQPGWLDALLDYADADPQPAIVGTRLLFPDGRLQHCGVVLCTDGYPRHLYAGFPGDHPLALRSGPAGIVTAACMLVRAEVFADLDGFSTAYRNGYEDVDLCLRATAAGQQVHYCHTSVLTHLVSATRESRRAEFAQSEDTFLARWGRLPATDFGRYLADGMIELEYGRSYPLGIRIDPELAFVLPTEPGARSAEQDLRDQVHRLRRENVELRMRFGGDRPGS